VVRQPIDEPAATVGDTVLLEPARPFHVFDAASTLRLGP
jgi:hypothetical protein